MAKQRPPVRREERIEPTPETAAKRQPDHVASLSSDLQEAAGAIALAYRLVVGPLFARAQDPNRVRNVASFDYTKAQQEVIARYRRWAGEMEWRRLPLPAVIDMVIEGKPPHECDRERHWPSGQAAERLIEGLELYRRMGS